LQAETSALLESGGLWKYSGDAHETLQALCKQVWLDFSSRGALGKNRLHPCEIIFQRHIMKVHLCTVEEGPRKLVIMKREQKTIEALSKEL
jgi:hypothetical protein